LKNRIVIAGIVSSIIIGIMVLVIIGGNEEQPTENPVNTESQQETKVVGVQKKDVRSATEVVDNIVPEHNNLNETVVSTAPTPAPNSDAPPENDPEPVHYINDIDPEDQPRSFHRSSFADREHFPDGFEITGEIYLSEDGWKLDLPATNPDGIPISGMIESPVIALDFPSNAISSGWKEVSPTGTEVLIEVAASPDGENWTSWYPTTGAHMDGEIVEFNEVSGEVNPNYGYTLGDMVFFGLGQYQYYKYSIMLYSETNESPTVSDFFIFQQDTTMGDGEIVEYSEQTDITKSEGS